MSIFTRSNFLPKSTRSFVAALVVIVLSLASTTWSTAFAWDPQIDLGLTMVDPGYRDDSTFNGFSDVQQASIAEFYHLGSGYATLARRGVAAAEKKVNLLAKASAPTEIGSVRLELTGSRTVSRTDNSAPFTLFEDIVGTALPAGTYQLSVTAYPEADLGGTAGTTHTASFTLVADTTAPSVSVVCGDGTPRSANLTSVTIEVSEPVLGFSPGDIAFTNVLNTGFIAMVGQGRPSGRWSYGLGAEPEPTGGETTVMVPAGVATDEVGNQNTASELLHIARNRKLSVGDASAEEGTDSTIEFDVTIDTRNDCETVTVGWTTADGTATAGDDYTSASGMLTFGPGETTKTVSVAVLDDEDEESDETFTLQLSNAEGATFAVSQGTGTTLGRSSLSAPASAAEATGTIESDDSAQTNQQQTATDTDPPTVTVTRDARGTTGLVRGRFDVTVTFSEPVSGFAMSDLEVTNGSAESMSPNSDGTQYTATIGPVSTGEVTVQVPAGVATDAADNPNTGSSVFDIWFIGSSHTSGNPTATLRCASRGGLGDSLHANIFFNKLVTGLDPGEIEVSDPSGIINGVGLVSSDVSGNAGADYDLDGNGIQCRGERPSECQDSGRRGFRSVRQSQHGVGNVAFRCESKGVGRGRKRHRGKRRNDPVRGEARRRGRLRDGDGGVDDRRRHGDCG